MRTATPERTLWLGEAHRSRHQLRVRYGLDDLRFATTFWYADVDLLELEERHGRELLERIYFHVTAFEANKLCCLRPERFDLGPYVRFHTRAFEALWRQVLRKVWAQWRYEHGVADASGPVFTSEPTAAGGEARELEAGPVAALSFCGGGKDSLVALKLLERAAIPFDTFAYSSSVYGRAEPQHALIDEMLDRSLASEQTPARRRMWIFDDCMDSPVARLHPELGSRYLLAGETPSSLFSVLPLALAHGYRRLVLAHERSADVGNLVWERTGEEVNHQWGKSLEAERLLAGYLAGELFSNLEYFSLLKPLYDVSIFNLLARDAESARATHSCNEQKPWCRRCAKCAYVWLGYAAYLPRGVVDSIFEENLFDVAENQLFFRQMLGLEEHTPFECIGLSDEACLAFEICRRRGFRGAAIETFVREVPAVDVRASLERFLEVDTGRSNVPTEVLERVRPLFEEGAADAQRRLEGVCGRL